MIPKDIYFCYKHLDNMEKHTKRWKTLNPEYTIHLYDNKKCRDFLIEEYEDLYGEIFDFLKDGPIKADFWRVCMLYKKGGVYSDLDNYPIASFKSFVEPNIHFLTCSSSWNYKSAAVNPNLIMSEKNSPILKKCIDWYLNKYKKNNKYEYWKWSIMCAMTAAFNIQEFNKAPRVMLWNNLRVQLLREWKDVNYYKEKKIFYNRSPNWDRHHHCLVEDL